MSKKRDIKIKVDLSYEDVMEYVREGLRRDGLIAPDDDESFRLHPDAVNADDVLVEVVGVSVVQNTREKGVSLSDLRAQTGGREEEAPRKKKAGPTASKEADPEESEEDLIEELKEINRFNRSMSAAPAKGIHASDASQRMARVGRTLDDLGKDPSDMSDEIG